jgi:hypothetical protein
MFFLHRPSILYLLAFFGALFGGLLLAASCNMPGYSNNSGSGVAGLYTAAARTVQARLTQEGRVVLPAAVLTPQTAANPSIVAPTPARSPSPTPAALLSPDPSACNQAKFLGDLSYPDGSPVEPGQSFVKTWQIQNTGTCTWTAEYSAVFTRGDPLGAPLTIPLAADAVPPGGVLDLSIPMVAPLYGGVYHSEWMLADASGALFGVEGEAKPVWVEVRVVRQAGTAYDFVAQAGSANWVSGAGMTLDTLLPFGEPETGPDGGARIVEALLLENGATSGSLLLTIPKQVQDGVISGIYPAYRVQPGETLVGRAGFAIPGGSCGEAKALFEIGYTSGSLVFPLFEVEKTCDGRLQPLDVDLSSLAGMEIRFVFTVRALGSPQEDWAAWSEAVIEQR